MNSVLTTNNTPPKSRQQIYQENYQKNKQKKQQQRRQRYQQDKEAEKAKQKERYEKDKEKKKSQQKLNYAKKKEEAQLSTKQQSAKYYGAEAFKVLMSLKQYTELNKDKMKLWTDFNWTLKDCKEDIHDIVAVMKLREVADNLVRDYWETAKDKEKAEKRSWNNLDYDQQQRLIKYWGYEKARIENGYIDELERLESQGDSYYKEIKLAKYHEERGKIKCDCWQCEEKAIIHKEVKAKIKKDMAQAEKELDSYWGGTSEKEKCPQCGKLRELDEVSGLCKSCAEQYE